MRAGDLRHRINIEFPSASRRNELGEVVTTDDPETVAYAVPASIRTLSVREKLANNEVSPTATHEVRMRYFNNNDERLPAGLTSAVLIFGNRRFLPDSVIDVEERHVELVIHCHEQTP